ncbi:ABC transporter transmembrane domain-containing protein [Actinopolymorpha cephalotaxi]|uniref:ABC-type multidrug transport system fused ATPase/permease subunit n=2 Tax=Actinopolymorpha cephalotaxi TaxID=504797 RepID=A0ABX2S4V6_9ACTN|nr:ABC transporter transmembrane domain-containing protein [Actinopolymorpha cephalotaxi]NYH84073.1 ABC-type multidrug transport system fused ATPase/permease subunit [Actinopolymorpha cephalotaxi]
MTSTMTRGTHTPPSERKVSDLRRSVRIVRRFKGGRRAYVGALALLAFEALTAIAEPYPIAYLVDFLQSGRPTPREWGIPAFVPSVRIETIAVLTLAIVLIAAINSAADSLAEVCMARAGRVLGYNLRVAMYSHLQRLSLAYHDKKRTGDVLTRVTGDVLVLEEFVVASISNIVGSSMVLVGTFAVLLWQSWNVALVALCVVPLLAGISQYFSRRIKAASKTQRTREGELASTAQEMLTSIRLVQSYGRGTIDLQRFSGQTEQSMRASLRTANVQAQFSFVIALAEALAISAVVWIGIFLLDRRAITVGTLVLFILLLRNMFKPARKIVSEWYKVGKVFASVERIDDLLDRSVDVRDEPDAVAAPRLMGRVTFRHVGFHYPAEHADGSRAAGRPTVLHDVDFEVSPGEVVALVGHSGAGKSTIAQLVPRLYDATSGAVLLDGHDLRGLTLASVRAQVSLVLQDTVLLSGTVAENIGYGIENATIERIQAAARAANAHGFIEELPDGYDTQLAERATTLSGGQRQRLSIARAFIRESPILILDEPTTGLDRESTRLVVDALRTLMRGRTTIIISHDPDLIRFADRVLEVVDGVIVEGPRPSYTTPPEGSGGDPEGSGSDPAGNGFEPTRRVHRPSMLAEPLHTRLPDLRQATDPTFAVQAVEQTLLASGAAHPVLDARVEKLWYLPDGSCALRYVVRIAENLLGGTADWTPERTVVARVHPDRQAATAYVEQRLEPLVERVENTVAAGPWRRWAGVVGGTGIALHPFPLDPALPSLARAVDSGALAELAGAGPAGWSSHVVHYPREGACVLRYERPPGDGAGPTSLYGKVYDDGGRGVAIAATLDALSPGGPFAAAADGLRLPRPFGYLPKLRLLLTEAVPGEPLMRAGSWAWSAAGSAPTSRAALESMASAGRVLAALHRREILDAQAYSRAEELTAVGRDLDTVRQVWPEVADHVHQHLAGLLDGTAEVPDSEQVLCHGDFTPAQLLVGSGDMALVDLDTVHRGERAADLGRFLAHLHLAGTKAAGAAAWPLLDELGRVFLRAYAEDCLPGAALDPDLLARVVVHRDASLARTALRACRQLKDDRLRTALELLDDNDDWTRRITR